jgi:transposase
VNAPVQYGDVIQSYAVYFQQQQFIPEDRLQETFHDLFKINLATATLSGFSESVYDDLIDFDSEILSKIKIAPVKHLGKTQWLHVASTTDLTYYHVSPKRKSLLEGLIGVVVHDHWKAYYQLSNALHALCNQHHLRELKALIEYDKESWAKKMQRFLRVGLQYRHAYKDKKIPDDKLSRLTNLYDQIVDEGIIFHENLPAFSIKKSRGRIARRTGHNLVLRLKNYRDDVLRFLTDPLVPFTNNQAERDIRMMKCKQKISGGFRSTKGADIFARIRGFISTARKQGWNIFESIQQVVRGCVPMPV